MCISSRWPISQFRQPSSPHSSRIWLRRWVQTHYCQFIHIQHQKSQSRSMLLPDYGCKKTPTQLNTAYTLSFFFFPIIFKIHAYSQAASAGDSRHWFDPWVRKTLEEEMALQCSILAWKILWRRGTWWATVMGLQKQLSMFIDNTILIRQTAPLGHQSVEREISL